MATILNSFYNRAVREFEEADRSRKQGTSDHLDDLMVGKQIQLLTGLLAKDRIAKLDLPTADKIHQLVVGQARVLPPYPIRLEGPSVDAYEQMILQVAEKAKIGGAREIRQELQDLQALNVFPRNGSQVDVLIDSQRILSNLRDAFEVACQIEEYYNPQPQMKDGEVVMPPPVSLDRIQRMKERLESLEVNQPIRALEDAKMQLWELECMAPKPKPFFAELHPTLAERPVVREPVRPSVPWSRRTWACIAGAAALAVALAILYRRS